MNKDYMKEFAEFLINVPGMDDETKEHIRNAIRDKLGIDPDSLALGGEFWTDERRKSFEETKKIMDEVFKDLPKQ